MDKFTKTELKNEILKANDGNPLIKLKKIAEIVGDKNPQRVKRKYLLDLQKINGAYFVPDVAERLKEHATL